ncbi:hypothetical protein Tco_0327742 [Tanacetum coccineum]
MSFPRVEKHILFSIIYEPVHGIIYKNSKKEKRAMRHSKIHKFCDATLNRVLEGLKSYNNDVKYGYVQRELTNDEVKVIGCLMYAMACTRPDIAFAVVKLSRYTSNPGAAGKEAKWLRNLMLEIPLWSKPTALISIRCASATMLARAYSQMYNRKSRHLDVRHSMIPELIMNGGGIYRVCEAPSEGSRLRAEGSRLRAEGSDVNVTKRAIYHNKVVSKPGYDKQWQATKLHEPLAEAKPAGMKAKDWTRCCTLRATVRESANTQRSLSKTEPLISKELKLPKESKGQTAVLYSHWCITAARWETISGGHRRISSYC